MLSVPWRVLQARERALCPALPHSFKWVEEPVLAVGFRSDCHKGAETVTCVSPAANLLLLASPLTVTRGDVFVQPEDEYLDYDYLANGTSSVPNGTSSTPVSMVSLAEQQAWTEEGEVWSAGVTQGPAEAPTSTQPRGEAEALCSGEPFDAFTSLKNGSIFAFRGSPVGEGRGQSGPTILRPPPAGLAPLLPGLSGSLEEQCLLERRAAAPGGGACTLRIVERGCPKAFGPARKPKGQVLSQPPRLRRWFALCRSALSSRDRRGKLLRGGPERPGPALESSRVGPLPRGGASWRANLPLWFRPAQKGPGGGRPALSAGVGGRGSLRDGQPGPRPERPRPPPVTAPQERTAPGVSSAPHPRPLSAQGSTCTSWTRRA